ncbi:Queuine tRNA-ribosyltransferase [Dirofilaria immitis]|nr:Queuine tRNA-ribosyltransferase [Dirofilaria immitis]
MFDYGTPEDCSNKRLEKALERTVKFSRELLRCDSFEGSAALIALCGGHSLSHHERCASAIGSIPKGCGFVLDIMQFAKRLRVLPKKLKVKKMSKVGTIEKALQLESFPDASGNIGSLDLVITESEFDKNVIKDLLAGVWPHISPSHLRLVNGAFSPTEVVALAHLGVDLFDSSYAIFLAEQGKAFVCSANFPHEATFNVFDFTDTLYSEDFRPLCKIVVVTLARIIQEKQQVEKNNLGEKSIRDLRLDKRFDWVGPPDDISKIRPVRLRRLTNETKQERKYREAREALNQWSSQFWARHNILFEKKKPNLLIRLEHSSAVDMSEFYKKFLDEQYNSLTNYNREWYYRNIRLFGQLSKYRLSGFDERCINSFVNENFLIFGERRF